MTSSKVILIGAISVVFGLYSLSLTRVQASLGNAAETNNYIAKAWFNARAGAQRAYNIWQRGVFYTSEGPINMVDGSFSYSVTYSPGFGYSDGSTISVTITSIGTYKSPNEPSAFVGHQVSRIIYAQFVNTNQGSYGNPWYDVKIKAAYTSVNYTRERQLDSLQVYKPNLIGY